jgi:hypothetical protein
MPTRTADMKRKVFMMHTPFGLFHIQTPDPAVLVRPAGRRTGFTRSSLPIVLWALDAVLEEQKKSDPTTH